MTPLAEQPIEKKLVMDQMLQHAGGQGPARAAYRNPLLAPMAEIMQYTKLHGVRALYGCVALARENERG